jgi:superfamily II DNA or RNA helicase
MNEITNILLQLNTFNDAYCLLNNSDNRTKGLFLELFTKFFFKIHHCYKDHIKIVYLYDEIPQSIKRELSLPPKDKGIDLIIKYDDDWLAIQCKYRQDPNSTVTWKELSTFFGLTFGINDKIKRGYYVTNTHNLCDEVLNSEKVIPITGNFLDNLDPSFFSNLKSMITNNRITFTKHIPLPHQQSTIHKSVSYFKKYRRGYIEYICGTGKTKTSYWIARELVCEKIAIFVPSLLLLSQFFDEWCYEVVADRDCPDFLLVGSDYDDNLDDKYKDKLDNIELTTDTLVITKKLQECDDLIVISTYQSANILIDACKKINYTFDFGIYDEAHKTAGQINKKFSLAVTDNNFKIRRRLFMTATPKIYNGNLYDDEVVSMDNIEFYGECIDSYNMNQAIQDGRLCDYQILTIHTTNNYIEEQLNNNKLVSIKNNYNFDELQSLYLASAIVIFKCLEFYECAHMITYHNSVKRSKDFSKLLIEINKLFYKCDIFIDSIDGGASMTARRNTIREFERSKLGIICSARVLNEGINIPIIDSECFIDPRNSTIDIIQCIGRSIRLYPGKKSAKIIIPILSSDIMDDAVDEGRYGNVIRMLKSLSTTDDGVKEYFILKNQKKPIVRNIIKNEILQNENYVTNVDISEWNDKINAILWTKTDGFMTMCLELAKWIEINQRMPSQHSKNIIEKRLGGWCNAQRQNKKGNKLEENMIKQLEKINKWYWEKDDHFDDNYGEVIKWVEKNERIPNEKSKDLIEKRLGIWCSNKRQNKKENKLKGERIKRLESIPAWYWKREDPFDKDYNRLVKWVAENKRIPSKKSKNLIEKQLGTWCSDRRKYKKQGKLDQEKIKMLQVMPGWYWEKTDYFSDDYNKFTKWVKENNKMPSQYSKNPLEIQLNRWCMRQREYKRKYAYDEEKVKRLEQLPFWYWNRDDKNTRMIKS